MFETLYQKLLQMKVMIAKNRQKLIHIVRSDEKV